MGKRRKGLGPIALVYGDHWSKRKYLILAGMIFPLLFSFLFLIELSYALSLLNNVSYDPISLYYMLQAKIGESTLIILFVISVIGFFSLGCYSFYVFQFFKEPLKSIHQEIFIQKKPNHYEILVKEFCIAIVHSFQRYAYYGFFLIMIAIVFIPSLISGYMGFTLLDVSSAPQIGSFLGTIPVFGETIRDALKFVFESIGREVSLGFQSLPVSWQALIVLVPILIIIPLSDLIEASVQRRQRGDFKRIMKNGLLIVVKNLVLPSKVANFISTTLVCLFTDQRSVALDVVVVNPRNVELAMQKVLGANSQCYVGKISFDPEKLRSEVQKCPPNIQEEIRGALKNLLKKGFVKQYTENIIRQRIRHRKSFQGQLEVARSINTIFGVNEEGVMAYAVVRSPPPNYMTRIIMLFWCSDPDAKNRILEKLEKLDSV
jgi:hypothetical protein